MSQSVRIRRGLNINLLGEADKVYASVKNLNIYALKPTDFHGLTPKLSVKCAVFIVAVIPPLHDTSALTISTTLVDIHSATLYGCLAITSVPIIGISNILVNSLKL